MKKQQIFGIVLFCWGMIGELTLLILSVQNPCVYNEINGFKAFLLSYDVTVFNYFFIFLLVISILIYFSQEIKAIYKKFKEWNHDN